MEAGDTFVLVNKQLDDHLWVILSDPKQDRQKVLIVSLTTAAPYKERVCLIHAGEHSWVRHETCVAYNHAKVVTVDDLHLWKDAGHLRVQDPVSAALLQRMRQRAADSVDLALHFAELLSEQGLLDV